MQVMRRLPIRGKHHSLLKKKEHKTAILQITAMFLKSMKKALEIRKTLLRIKNELKPFFRRLLHIRHRRGLFYEASS